MNSEEKNTINNSICALATALELAIRAQYNRDSFLVTALRDKIIEFD